MTQPPTQGIRVGEGEVGDPAAPNAYDVLIGHGVRRDLERFLPRARQALVVHSPVLGELASALHDDLVALGLTVTLAPVPDAEQAKTAGVAAHLWQVLGQAGFTRSDVVLGLGGGAVTDVAGFVAATWLRGVRVIQIPTSLLAMIDAGVGGKTGINTAEGKNLVGAFHPPAAVLCDLATLATLPRAELVAGLSEVVKTGFIADPVILDLIEGDPEAAVDPASTVLRELVERSIAVKARVVTADLREAGLREILNYGHTFAHAVEQVERYTWRHGAAVAVGQMYAAELGHLTGHTSAALVRRHRAVLELLGLPTTYPGQRWEALATAMRRDKKTRGDLLRFVVLEDVGRPVRLEGPDPALLEAAYRRLAPG